MFTILDDGSVLFVHSGDCLVVAATPQTCHGCKRLVRVFRDRPGRGEYLCPGCSQEREDAEATVCR